MVAHPPSRPEIVSPVVSLLERATRQLLFARGYTQWREGFDETLRDGKWTNYAFHYLKLANDPTPNQQKSIIDVLSGHGINRNSIEFSFSHDGAELRILNGEFETLKAQLQAVTAGVLGK